MILITRDLQIYDTDTFGMQGWGTNHQESIDCFNGKWYYHVWVGSYRSDYEDVDVDYPLDVIKTFDTLEEAQDFVLRMMEALLRIERDQINLDTLVGVGRCE